MSMHLAGWFQSVDPAGSPVALDAMLDERLFTEGKNIRVNELTMIMGGGAVLTNAADIRSAAYIYTPTLNIMGNSYIVPVQSGTTAATVDVDHVRWADYSDSPVEVAYDELMRAYVSADPAAAGSQAVFILMTDGNIGAVPSGTHINWSGNFDAPATTGQWAQVQPTWASELPPGDYAIIGMQVLAPTTLAARLNTRQGKQWRPGVLAQASEATLPADFQKAGMNGVWGTFPYTQLPTLEICATTAAAGYVHLDIVRMSERTNPRAY